VQLDELMKTKKASLRWAAFSSSAGVLSVLLLADVTNFHVRMALICVLWLAAVGMADDWLKLTASRRAGSRQGLTSLEKLLFSDRLGVVLSYFTYQHAQHVPDAIRSTSFFQELSRS